MRAGSGAAIVGALLLTGPGPACGWEETGHDLVNRTAAEALPEEVPEFFREAVDRLAWLGSEPDRWRGESEATLAGFQGPEHFLKLDLLGADFPFGPDRWAFYRELEARRASGREDLRPERVGLLLYATVETYQRVKVAFRQYRELAAAGRPTGLVEGNVLTWAGWLGHYAADGAQPHHTSRHYDGYLRDDGTVGQRGIHRRFEATFVDDHLDELRIRDLLRPPRVLASPFDDVLAFLREAHALVDETYRIDREGGFTTATGESLDFTRERLAAGTQMLLDLWYTAWVTSAD